MKFIKSKSVFQAIILVTLVAILQVFLLNLDYWKYQFSDNSISNMTYELGDFEVTNWQVTETALRSEKDPILVLPNISCNVDRILIETQLTPTIPYLEVFYVNDVHTQYGEVVIHEDNPKERTTVEIGDTVKDLRIDLGDDPGTKLDYIKVTVNPEEFQFSISILVAVVIIYFCCKYLFSLQKAPDYGLNAEIKMNDESN